MPITLHAGDQCLQLAKNSYFAYAEEVVYEVAVVEKSYAAFPKYCTTKASFGGKTLGNRLGELRTSKERAVETVGSYRGRKVYKFSYGGTTRWIMDDLEKLRWIEVAVTKRLDRNVNEGKFFESIDLANDLEGAPGTQVGLGAERTLGDANPGTPSAAIPPKSAVDAPLLIIVTPRASYTERARQRKIQGTVRVRVTFLSNGGIGRVDVVQDVEGLTEQAIDAAKKIVFLPKRVNGVPVSVMKTLEYEFRID